MLFNNSKKPINNDFVQKQVFQFINQVIELKNTINLRYLEIIIFLNKLKLLTQQELTQKELYIGYTFETKNLQERLILQLFLLQSRNLKKNSFKNKKRIQIKICINQVYQTGHIIHKICFICDILLKYQCLKIIYIQKIFYAI